jgi:hypothetical protein
MLERLIAGLCLAAPLASQVLVVDRGAAPAVPISQIVERGQGFFGDAFRIGSAGETWMIDTIRLWAVPGSSARCPRELGDRIEKLTLLGALDNPPVPGQPACDCHALVAIAAAPLAAGGSRSLNSSVALSFEKDAWRIDFQEVRWSVPGGADVLFSLRASPRKVDGCRAAVGWKLSAAPAPAGYRLHLLDKAGVPVGLADEAQPPRAIRIQVRAHRTQPMP